MPAVVLRLFLNNFFTIDLIVCQKDELAEFCLQWD